jgi:hypothetical protein
MTDAELSSLVDRCVAELGEHCDAVVILVSLPLNDGTGGTGIIRRGCGNHYARRGMVQEYQERYSALENAELMAAAFNPPPPP